MIIKFSYRPSLDKTLLLTGRVNYVGHNYYFVKISLKEYFLSSTLSFQLGDKITFHDYVDNLMPAPNIYQFDFSKYLENNGIYYAIKVQKIINLVPTHDLRKIISNYVMGQNSPINGMISLLLYGQQITTVENLYNNFVCLGIIHLLVVSGYHINVLFFLLNKLLMRIFHYGELES